MASFSGPKLSNRIIDDVPDIQVLLSALAKLTPDSGNSDYPVGTKRLSEGTNGYEFQQWNGTSWVILETWNINAQKVDGFSASAGITANTIPVRDKEGKLSGDLTGNAATATSAKSLSETNPIGAGGTGGTTAEQARSNLGVAPVGHASATTNYGAGSDSLYGHLKLSNSTSSASGVTGGTAATPKAVSDAKAEAIAQSESKLTTFAEGQAAKDATQNEAITRAQNTANSASSAAATAQTSANNAATAAATAKSTADSAVASIGNLAKVATSGSYNDLANKPSIPATPKAYLIATWRSGTSWYRKYSDGFIEQGGRIAGTTTSGTVSYPIAFATTDYTVTIGQWMSSSNDTDGVAASTLISNFSTTGFRYSTTNQRDDNWIAMGY